MPFNVGDAVRISSGSRDRPSWRTASYGIVCSVVPPRTPPGPVVSAVARAAGLRDPATGARFRRARTYVVLRLPRHGTRPLIVYPPPWALRATGGSVAVDAAVEKLPTQARDYVRGLRDERLQMETIPVIVRMCKSCLGVERSTPHERERCDIAGCVMNEGVVPDLAVFLRGEDAARFGPAREATLEGQGTWAGHVIARLPVDERDAFRRRFVVDGEPLSRLSG